MQKDKDFESQLEHRNQKPVFRNNVYYLLIKSKKDTSNKNLQIEYNKLADSQDLHSIYPISISQNKNFHKAKV